MGDLGGWCQSQPVIRRLLPLRLAANGSYPTKGTLLRSMSTSIACSLVRSATNEHAISVDIDLSSVPFVGYDPFAANRKGNNRRMTGWL